VTLLGHLGMTGRIYLARKNRRPPRHAAVVLDLGGENLIYEDTRYFGRLTLDTSAVKKLGPEPLDGALTIGVRAVAETVAAGHQNQIAGSNAHCRHRQHLRE